MATSRGRRSKAAVPAPQPVEQPPGTPSFGMCEGVRNDLLQTEKTVDPFTGAVITRDDVK